MTECTICVETFNKTVRKPVTCSQCQHVACMACVKTYLLQTVHQPHCMHCRKEWDLDMLNSYFSQSFLSKEYRAMRETILFEEEKTYLPALQQEAERLLTIERLDVEINKLDLKKRQNHENEDQLVKTQRQIHRDLTTQIDGLIARQIDLRHNGVRNREKKEFVMKCPMEDCRGFLSNRYKCGLCEANICKDCHKRKPEETTVDQPEHVCNPDDVATITELNRSTKPCPKCQCRIYKIDGCDQMFCIQCHTAFSWRTGQVESGVIHNPHYFEALRVGNIRDIRHRQHQGGCGPMPTFYEIRGRLTTLTRDVFGQVSYMYQQITHHRNVTLVRLAHRENLDADRIKYLMRILDEKKFKQHVYVSHQVTARKREEQEIVNSYVTIGEELFREMNKDNVKELLQQLHTLQKVTYDAIIHIDKKYQHKGSVHPKDIIHDGINA